MRYGVLERCNAPVTVFETGLECLKNLTALRPTVLIADIGMSEMDGYSLIKAVGALSPQGAPRRLSR